ncbi:FMN-dependent NADH-azoreductase [Millisia brevis]|uniref:FMN-dependent NADH-azoreductase n=1 Tax=Millisia brevis TaxID=264148 RepID=UPI0008300E33|nr:NAD(P)H-dependent oxidoreductase [Millisia brevis]
MTKLLHINSSPRPQSQSAALAQEFLDAYSEASGGTVSVTRLDLFLAGLPKFDAPGAEAKYAAFSGDDPVDEAAAAWAAARVEFERFAAADEYLFNIPMWNAGVPYILKQWIDIVTQPGWAFGFDPVAGYNGLLEGKRAVVIYTAGVYSVGCPPAFGSDFHSTFFKDWLEFVGITEVEELRYQANVISQNSAEEFELAAKEAQRLGRSLR